MLRRIGTLVHGTIMDWGGRSSWSMFAITAGQSASVFLGVLEKGVWDKDMLFLGRPILQALTNGGVYDYGKA